MKLAAWSSDLPIRERCAAVALGVLFLAAGPLPAQEPPADSGLAEEVEVRYVLLDALVVDSRGRTAPDLSARDFELWVDSIRHPIESVDMHCPSGSVEDPRPIEDGERRAVSPAPAVPQRVVIAIDYTQLPQTRRAEVVHRVRDMVRANETPSEELMVAAITRQLRIEQPFTTDREDVLRTLDRMENDPTLWQEPVTMAPHHVRFFEALLSLIGLLSEHEGNKAIVLISGVPSQRRPGGVKRDFTYDPQFDAIAAAAAEVRVPIYPVHASGLDLRRSSNRLARLAVDTGGRFTERTNDLSLAYARAQRDLSCRYTVGFYDTGFDRDRTHVVTLNVRGKGSRVYHPTKYRFDAAKASTIMTAEAWRAPDAYASQDVSIRLFALRPLGSGNWEAAAAMRFAVEVPESASRVVSFGLKVEDQARRQVFGSARSLTVAPGDAIDTKPIAVVEPVELPPGVYVASVVVDDPAKDGPQTAVTRIELPDLPKRGYIVTEPILVRAGPDDAAVAGAALLSQSDETGLDTLVSLTQDESVVAGPIAALTRVCRIGRSRGTASLEVSRELRAEGRVPRVVGRPRAIDLSGGEKALRCESIVDRLTTDGLEPATYGFVVSLRDDHGRERASRSTRLLWEPAQAEEPVAQQRESTPVEALQRPQATTEQLAAETSARSAYASIAEARLDAMTGDTEGLPSMDVILARLSRVADLYTDGALGFTCDELISYRRAGNPRYRVRYRYIYRVEEGRLKDYRVSTALGKRRDRDAKDDFDGPTLLLRPYSWIASFAEKNQALNTYRLLGKDELMGVEAIKLWVAPTDPDTSVTRQNQWVGTFWVNLATYQLLKVEAHQLGEFQGLLRLERALDAAAESRGEVEASEHSVERVTTLFGTTAMGIRYPSRAVLERRRYQVPFDEALTDGVQVYLVQQDYSNYQMYTTKTSEEMRRFVLGP